jgi:Transposase DDE domain
LLRNSIQRELNDFFAKINNADFSIQEVTKGAFSTARSKLKHTAFIELSNKSVTAFYQQAPHVRWGEFRVLACDGSTVLLPKSKSIAKDFPLTGFGRNADCEKSLAKISLVYDVFNQVTLNAKIDAFKVHETALFKQQLEEVEFMPNDLILLDRGYPSVGLLNELLQRNIHFCVRLKDNWWKEVNKMLEDGETDKIVKFSLPKKQLSLAEKFNTTQTDFEVRIVVVALDNGNKEILCASLLCPIDTTPEDLKWLYHQRWTEEEAYKMLKTRIDVANFSGMTSLSVQQDFYAAIFTMNMCAILAHPIAEKIRTEKNTTRKHQRKINRTNAISYISKSWVGIFIKRKFKQCLENFDKMLINTTEVVRPNRNFPRNHKQQKPKSMNYKPL